MLKIAFFGTPHLAADLLSNILLDTNFEAKIQFVVTQPDKPVGRKQIITPSPVKKLATIHGITTYTKLPLAIDELPTVDVCLVYAYGRMIPDNFLQIPSMGFWNIHPSLLPKYRGASPISYPIILGDNMTGVSLMKLDHQLDHGPIIIQEKLPISPTQPRSDIEMRLNFQAFNLLKQLVTEVNFDRQRIDVNRLQEQNHDLATLTRTLQKDDGYISFTLLTKALKNEILLVNDLPKILVDYFQTNNKLSLENWQAQNQNSAQMVFNLYRGLSPWPGIWTNVQINNEIKRLKIIELELIDGKLQIKQLQLEGKNPVDFKTFNTAYKLF